MEKAVRLAVAGDVFDGVFLCCPFSPRDVLHEIWDLIGSVSEGFLTYSHINSIKSKHCQKSHQKTLHRGSR